MGLNRANREAREINLDLLLSFTITMPYEVPRMRRGHSLNTMLFILAYKCNGANTEASAAVQGEKD